MAQNPQKPLVKLLFAINAKHVRRTLINLAVYGAFWERFCQKGAKYQNPLVFSPFSYAFSRRAKTMETIRKAWFCEGADSRSENLINTVVY